MKETLVYDRSPSSQRRLMSAMLIALVVGPTMAVGAAVFGCMLALDSWSLSPPNLNYSITWGAVCGATGGLLTALLARARRNTATSVSLLGSFVVAAVSGGSLFVYASMLAAV